MSESITAAVATGENLNSVSAPGLGLTLDEAAAEQYEVSEISKVASRYPWGRRPGAGLYEVPYTEEERRGEKLPLD